MSYKIGQFRGDSSFSYLSQIENIQIGDRITEASSIERIYFKDKKFSIKDSFFNRNINYYVKIEIERPVVIVSENNKNRNSNQQFVLFLKNENQDEKSSQFLKSFYVPSIEGNARQEEKYVTLELIFNPSLTFSSLVLQMKRTGADYLEYHEEEGFYGRVAIIKKVEFYTINNILNSIAVENNQESSSINFVKIGIQGPSGMLMCINGQEIRIWPSGIYEIKNGYKVSFLGFIVSEGDSFIVDYQY